MCMYVKFINSHTKSIYIYIERERSLGWYLHWFFVAIILYNHLRHISTENVTTMGNIDTSNMVMIIRWVITISSRPPKLEWTSLITQTTSHIAKKRSKVIERFNEILDTPLKEYTQQSFTHASRIFLPYVFKACEQICIMMIMRGGEMLITEHNLNSLRPNDAYMRRQCNHDWFR